MLISFTLTSRGEVAFARVPESQLSSRRKRWNDSMVNMQPCCLSVFQGNRSLFRIAFFR